MSETLPIPTGGYYKITELSDKGVEITLEFRDCHKISVVYRFGAIRFRVWDKPTLPTECATALAAAHQAIKEGHDDKRAVTIAAVIYNRLTDYILTT